jgi:wobble nucleotide-excising tRNase
MSKTLTEIAQQLSTPKTVKRTVSEKTKEVEEIKPVPKVQLIYAFNGTGKTRLSRAFKELIARGDGNDTDDESDAPELSRDKILYYNALTEDLFYWDNDLERDAEPKLKIQPNTFTDWVLVDQGQDRNIIATFQRYTNNKLTPHFNAERSEKDKAGKDVTIKAFSEVTFTMEKGDEKTHPENLKLSKGEESNFIWSIFYTLLDQVISVLNVPEPGDRESGEFDQLEYVFIDDPVSSLDENHLIQLAVDLSQLIKSSLSDIKFVITTHNPLFYNVLHNELDSDDGSYKRKQFRRYRMVQFDDGGFDLIDQPNDSPFSYHLYLKAELEKAIESGQVGKYHFNFLRNILEKTSTFLGYKRWGDLLPKNEDGRTNPYEARIINISSHSKHSGEEVAELTEDDRRVLKYLVRHLNETYRFEANGA